MTTRHDLDTPAVNILLDRLENNISRVQAMVSRHGMANRPHIKTHKIPAIAKLQMKGRCDRHHLPEARRGRGVQRGAGADDILLTFNIVGERKTDRLMELSTRVKRLAVVADNEVVVRACRRRASATAATCRCSSNATPASGGTACRARKRRCARALRHEHAAHPFRGADDFPDARAEGGRVPHAFARSLP
jgi:D-serine deaminase-like pyridoxal phosphate-dependent protein